MSGDAEQGYAYVSPRGLPDSAVSHNEARLWLLSQADRARGRDVIYRDDIKRWAVDGRHVLDLAGQWVDVDRGKPSHPVAAGKATTCTVCKRPFMAKRSSAKYCSGRCRQRAHKGAVTLTVVAYTYIWLASSFAFWPSKYGASKPLKWTLPRGVKS